jgi:signal transduction histidine kinase/PAS domain-containing protein
LIAVIRVLYLHPPSPTATRVATAFADADPAVTVYPGTTDDDAREILEAEPVDCVVNAFDPTDEAGRDLIRLVGDLGPDLPQVLAPAGESGDVAEATAALVDRVVAAVGADAVGADALLAAVPGIGAVVTSTGEIRRWNADVSDLLGSEAGTRGTDVTALAAPPARDRLAEALALAAETGRHVVEAPVETPAGERLDYEWTLTRLDDGRLAVVALDVSEWATAAAELRATETSLAALYETLSDRDLTFEDRLQRVLELGCDRFGVDYGFLTRITGDTQRVVASAGSHPSLQPNEQCPLSEAYCRKTIRGEGLLGVHDAAADGWVDDPAYDAFGLGCYLGGKVLVDGDLYGTLCFADDDAREAAFTDVERTFVELLTRWVSYELEQRAAREELERQNERLSEFASIVSHDIRSPLNVASGKLQLARETGETSHLAGAEAALGRMESLVTDLLDLARQGSVIESVEEVELGAVVEAAWASVATDGAELVVEADGVVEADDERLKQLLENLFRNSVEHGSTGSGGRNHSDGRQSADDGRTESRDGVEHGATDTLTVTVGISDRGFYIADTGPGIPPDERETVLERGHSTNDGTGLGLAIVQAIAEAHGWAVTVDEGDDGGARFEFIGVDRPVSA